MSSPAPRIIVVSALCCAFQATVAAAAPTQSPRRMFSLPRGDAATTLKLFIRESGLNVIFMVDKVRGVQTNAVAGEFSAREALQRMIAGTNLTVVEDDRTGAVLINRVATSEPRPPPAPPANPASAEPPSPMNRNHPLTLLAVWLGLSQAAMPELRSADTSPATGGGTVRGQVFNPATQQYVRNAEIQIEGTNGVTYTGPDGSYVFANVPAGPAKIQVTYTGYETVVASVQVSAGQTAVRNFDLVGVGFKSADRGGVVKLGQFVVSTEREGNAKAIMEQRASLNMKNVVASDNFGEITGGHVGEFIKYLPGVVMDIDDYGDPFGVRLGGLDPKYASVTVDGSRMASGGNAAGLTDTARQFDINLISITGIESIEVNKTTTASMDADAPAGSVNLRSKNAFERKGREITAQVNLTGNSYDLSLKKSPGPNNDQRTFKVLPGATLSYSNVFGSRFGVHLSVGSSGVFTTRKEVSSTYNTSLPARGPLITQLTFQEAPKVINRSALGASFDFKLTPELILSIGTNASYLHSQNGNFSFRFVVNPAQITPASTPTRIVTQATANVNTRLETFGQQNDQFYNTVTHNAKLEFKRGDLTLTGSGSYALSRTHLEDLASGLFQAVNMRLTRMSWMAERSSSRSTDWTMTQLSGRPWSDISSFGRDDPFAGQINANPRSSRHQIFTGQLVAKKTFALGLPLQMQAGLKSRLTTYDKKGLNFRLSYVGPTGNQLDPTAVFIPETQYRIDPKQGGNLASLGLPSVNRYGMYNLYVSNPSYFVSDSYANTLDELLGGASAIKELIDAGYVETSTKWERLRLNFGARHERTKTTSRIIDVLPAAAVRAAGYTPGTVEFAQYQYRNGQRTSKTGSYDNWFLSGGAKYSLTKNLVFHLAGSQSIGRPGYDQLAGSVVVDEVARIVRVPNPRLRPETSNKYFGGVQYYLEPSGVLGISAYQLDVKDMGGALTSVSADAAGYGDDPEYAGFSFLQTVNLDGTRSIQGVEIEYSQQLVFLPGIWRGLSVFGSITRVASDLRVPGLVPKAASGGIRYSNHRFNVQLRSAWTAASGISFSPTLDLWWYERVTFDLSGGYRLSRTYDLTLSGRNLGNAPKRSFANEPGLLARNIYMGAVWTIGIRGRF